MDLASLLNPPQLEAVHATDGPVLILAGAGSGKTRVITYRVAYLVEGQGVRPDSILAVTFTNKAADQMKQRVRSLLRAARTGDPLISTFHSFCVRLLRREIEAIGYSRDFTIYDDSDQVQVIRAAMKTLKVEDRSVTPKTILGRISHAKNAGMTPERMLDDNWGPSWESSAAVFKEYQRQLKKSNALDFDDLLIKAVDLFDQFPETAEKYSRRFQYIMVDEYQDTNRQQYRLARHLTRTHDNLCVVGDEDQSIYSWRGADIQNILSFEKDFPRARVIRLEQNYRSTQTILSAAGAVVANNEMRKGKTLWTQNPKGDRIALMEAEDADAEALFVSERILEHRRVAADARIAILYRANFLSRALEEKLRRYNVDYRIVGGFSFYERAEIKDLIAYLTVALNPNDSVHLLRIINSPPRGIGKTTIDALEDLAVERETSIWNAIEAALLEERFPARTAGALKSFHTLISEYAQGIEELSTAELLERIATTSRYLAMLEEEGTDEALTRVENIRELLTAAAESGERGETLREFLDHAALVSDQDDYEEKTPVTLMTLHTAKGLEFPIVFIVGVEDDILPHSRSKENKAQLEEERRLFYVGITRAERKLYLTRAQFRRFFGGGSFDMRASEPSPFLNEIPADLLDDVSPSKRFRRPAAIPYPGPTFNTPSAVSKALGSQPQGRKSSSKWTMGTRVKHAKYGHGTVLRVEGEGDDMKLTVSFVNHGLKKMIARYAELEQVK